MGGRGTALLVGGLVLLAGLAAADAVRKSGLGEADTTNESTTQAATPATGAEPDPREILGDMGVEGVLYATVAVDAACEFQEIGLPELTTAHLLRAPACRFDVSPDGRHVAFGSPCPAERVFVRELEQEGFLTFEGCSPAWRPDGRLTYVRRGDVVALDAPDCERRSCLTTLVSARDLISRLDLRVGDRVASSLVLRQIGWFTPRRLVAVVAAPPLRREFVAVLEGRQVLRHQVLVARSFTQLQILPSRREASVTSLDRIRFVHANGDYGGSAPPVGARAVAYPPGEDRYVAASSGQGCFYLSPRTALVCIPLEAADLEWR